LDTTHTLSRYSYLCSLFFSFMSMALSDIYTLSLHDALPILDKFVECVLVYKSDVEKELFENYILDNWDKVNRKINENNKRVFGTDRKSTRLNSSHVSISYAVFCLKKKKKLCYVYKLQ